MRQTLTQFLDNYRPVAVEQALWGAGTLPLRVATYLTPDPPPLSLVTSVRGLLCRAGKIMLMQNKNGSHHIVPGGRRETGEGILDTLRRELLEETGWQIAPRPRPLGFIHFHHLAPRPPDFPHPYPDFMQMVFVAQATTLAAGAERDESYEQMIGFRPADAIWPLVTEPGQRQLLRAALDDLHDSGTG